MRGDAEPCLAAGGERPAGAVRGNVAYVSGVPMDIGQRRQLYINFIGWCGGSPVDLYVSTWRNAVVAQNFKSARIDMAIDGHIREPFPWCGRLDTHFAPDGDRQQVWEDRGDFPWLAYQDTASGRQLQGVFIDSGEVRVFRLKAGEEMPHFKGCAESLGFSRFALGHAVLRGEFSVTVGGEQTLRLAPGFWGDAELTWSVHDLDARSEVARGEGSEVRFRAAPQVRYMVEVRRSL